MVRKHRIGIALLLVVTLVLTSTLLAAGQSEIYLPLVAGNGESAEAQPDALEATETPEVVVIEEAAPEGESGEPAAEQDLPAGETIQQGEIVSSEPQPEAPPENGSAEEAVAPAAVAAPEQAWDAFTWRVRDRVGIGTVLPGSNLDIVTAGPGGARIQAGGQRITLKGVNDPAAYRPVLPYIEWRQGDDTRAMYMGWGNSTSGSRRVDMRLENGYNLAITGGRVGIGTASPGAGLHVSGSGGNGIILIDRDGKRLALNPNLLARNEFASIATYVGSNMGLQLATNEVPRLTIASGGNVGIGTTSPSAGLHVSGSGGNGIILIDRDGKRLALNPNLLARNEFASIATYVGSNMGLQLATNEVPRLTIASGGNVGIGTPPNPLYKLLVNGSIRVSGGSFIDDGVTLNVPDYVFEEDYPLMPLDDLAAYIAREKHLPNVPSQEEIHQDGLNLSQFHMRLLEKVEELTLYTLAQEEQLKAQQAQIESLQQQQAEFAARLAALEQQ